MYQGIMYMQKPISIFLNISFYFWKIKPGVPTARFH
jgi:hypothetical protein